MTDEQKSSTEEEETNIESSSEESEGDRLTELERSLAEIKDMLSGNLGEPKSDKSKEESKQNEKEAKADEPKEEKVAKPHPSTIKLAETLKRQMGKHYVKEWDKLPIDERINKMEAIIEFTGGKIAQNNRPKYREASPPKGQEDDERKQIVKMNGQNYAALAKNLNKF